MMAIQNPQTIGPAILPLLGERAGVRASNSLAKPLIESPVRGDIYIAPAFKPGLQSLKNFAADPEAARQRESGLQPFPSVYGDCIPKTTPFSTTLRYPKVPFVTHF
jgi:hypothetical protein